MRRWVCGLLASLMLFATARAENPTAGQPLDDDALLGPVFESQAAGIALRGPAGAKTFRRPAGNDVVQFTDESRKWTLGVTRAHLSGAVKLAPSKGPDGSDVPGLLDTTVAQIKTDKPDATILRNDVVTLSGGIPVGMIAAKYNLGLDAFLLQQALVRVSDRNYFVLSFITPAPRTGELEDDADTRLAVETFTAVLDSVRLLDQSEIREEQAQRLFRSRTFFVSLNETRIRSVLQPVQWLRIIEDGKDIGYTYVVEEVARDLPRKNARAERQAGAEGPLIGVRTRTMREGVQVDSESWMFSSFDRRNESWSTVVAVQDPKQGRLSHSELGVSTKRTKAVPDKGSVLEKGNRDVTLEEEHLLSVTRIGRSANAEPIRQELPVFYVQQAINHLLPRLLPRNDPKTYMFAAYVAESAQVKARYVDVGREESVMLDGKTFRATPVKDRIGLEGSVTTHYISSDGTYLGSVNDDLKLTIVPTDAKTLEKLWQNANLTRPGDVEDK